MWQLDIVGDLNVDSGYVKRLIKSVDSTGLSSSITWHGRLSDAALADQMANSHVLVIPSSYEGFGIAYLEGMVYGLPAIGTTSGAAHEIINNGQNGFLIAPDDADSLARHIATMHKDRQLLAQHGPGRSEKQSWARYVGNEYAKQRVSFYSILYNQLPGTFEVSGNRDYNYRDSDPIYGLFPQLTIINPIS